MKRLRIAIKAFKLIITSKDISFLLRYNKEKELKFEKGCYANATEFLDGLRIRESFPDYILNQYKEVLTDYNHKI